MHWWIFANGIRQLAKLPIWRNYQLAKLPIWRNYQLAKLPIGDRQLPRRSNIDGNSRTISSEDRDLVFLKKNVMIPEGARYCPEYFGSSVVNESDRSNRTIVNSIQKIIFH